MKKATALFLALMAVSTLSQANPNHHMRSGHHHHARNEWIGPLVIGGVLGYALSQPRQVVVQQPVIVPAPVYYPNTYPPVPYGYHYEQIVDAGCNCYRWVLVPN